MIQTLPDCRCAIPANMDELAWIANGQELADVPSPTAGQTPRVLVSPWLFHYGLQHDNPRVRELAVCFFGALCIGAAPAFLKRAELQTQLRRIARGDEDWDVRQAAEDALFVLATGSLPRTA